MPESKPKIIVTEDGSHTLYLEDIDETYHSFHGAWQESNHVFIDAGLRYALNITKHQLINILEIGFGTGLNAILTVLDIIDKDHSINYHSLEPFPLSLDLIKNLNYSNFFKNRHGAELFRSLHTSEWEKSVGITANFFLHKHKVTLQNFRPASSFELIYFDAFAPGKQAELWSHEIIGKLTGMLITGGILVTYCARGQFKRDLASLGLDVQTLPGPPGKKEMVRAIKK